MSTFAASRAKPPLAEAELARVTGAVTGLTPAQLQWVSGYVAGLAAANHPQPVTGPGPEPGARLRILYGSQTGNGEGVAAALASRAEAAGFPTELVNLADYKTANLKRETLAVFIVSTHGEGDPPDDAELFHEFLLSSRAPRLPELRYAVLALGDSAYVNFCQTGLEVDARLAELGATRVAPLVECDVDFDDAAGTWSDSIIAGLPDWLEIAPAAPRLRAVASTPTYSKSNPFLAEVLANQKITGRDSGKDVRHVELSLEGSGLTYEPGDSLAVVASNPPTLVSQFLQLLDAQAEDVVTLGNETVSLGDALSHRLEITAGNAAFLREWAGLTRAPALVALLEDGCQDELTAFLDAHQVIDVVRRYPAEVDASRFVSMLRKLSPRSYSIASSPRANPDEVHLTVAAVRYEAFGSDHWGAASTHVADRSEAGATLAVYVEPNSRFRLPDDDATDIIMIGPGTGVAPFRAFVEERAERSATGRNWLFFGDRTFSNDFLYQLEWLRHLKQGTLHRLDVAFSRDQAHKVYVQDRIRERAADVWDWLEAGAVIYLCGDAKYMAKDVNDALVDVISTCGGLDRDAAQQRLAELRRAGRYKRDVY